MGRPLSLWQCTPYNCGASTIWQVQDSYDWGGDITSWTHPWPFTINNTVSAAQQVTDIQSSWSDSTHPPTLANPISYTAWGAPSALTNGCVGSGCGQGVETYAYNKQLQLAMLELGNPNGASAVGCWVYNYYPGNGNASSCAFPSQGSYTNNNGNLAGYYYQDTSWVT